MNLLKYETPTLITLKDLVPLSPWKTSTPPFCRSCCPIYIKIKEPLLKDGVTVYWQAMAVHREADDIDFEVPCGGLFKIIDKHVFKAIRWWVDKMFGELFGLAKFDNYHSDLCPCS
ncbi:hypothetical protein DITRI_Ditri03aG0219900 [Diplodiscus trichospermus]